jgi:hypothetical protein
MIPTTEELLNEHFINVDTSNIKSGHYSVIKEAMIEFAKLHCEAQVKAIVEKVTLNLVEYAKYRGTIIKTENIGQEVSTENLQAYIQADSNSILTAYPLSNIK